MTKYTKIVMALLLATAMSATSVLSADTNNVVKTYPTPTTSLFNAGEVGISLSSGYVVDRAALFKDAYSVNLAAGAFWFPYRNWGFDATVPFFSTKGVSVSEVQVGTILRVPLAKDMPFFQCFAPYIGVGGVYAWKSQEMWAYVGKVGIDFRLNKKWSIFTEAQFRDEDFQFNKGQTSLNSGIKLVF